MVKFYARVNQEFVYLIFKVIVKFKYEVIICIEFYFPCSRAHIFVLQHVICYFIILLNIIVKYRERLFLSYKILLSNPIDCNKIYRNTPAEGVAAV